ncbi:peptidoglycan-binding protein [Bosea psychrotolerans]|uniref:Putative chitinase n=1 Tax=Bosea psychrotolerans TaxID=1871628 RepID=A0A2S4MD12_9HYPH|nr:peptidoglycan-binding protein [Bosea psychrotolerans]POR52604.1 putative chitinase [Bosea psychrotolerans]
MISNWDLAKKAGIVGANRTEHFIAQLATETGGFRFLSENLNYSALRLRQIFPNRVSEDKAAELAHQPVKIANWVYGNRLGNHLPSDGWTYRGSGLIQLTGRANFRSRGSELKLRLEEEPELARNPLGAFQTAVAFWKARSISALADRDDIASVRKAINGGSNGLAETRIWLVRVRKYLNPRTNGFESPELSADEQSAVVDRLKALGFLSSEPGAFIDSDISAPLKKLQSSRGLEETGVLDEDTLYEITEPAYFRAE